MEEKRKPSIGKSWEDEVKRLAETFYAESMSLEVQTMMLKFKTKYSRDPLVREFYEHYETVVGILKHIQEAKIPEPLDKLAFLASYLNAERIKEISAFIYLMTEVNNKYKLFDESPRQRKNNLTANQSAVLNRSLSPIFQWLPKIKLHLEGHSEVKPLFDKFTVINTVLNTETKMQDLERLFKDRGPDPFHSIFRRRNNAALNRIATCKTKEIADFLIRHPDYADAFLKKASAGGRNFLDEFYADPVSIQKMLNGPTDLRDKVNYAYGYWARTPLPVSLDSCREIIHSVVMPKVLRDALIEKIESAHQKGFPLPDSDTMKGFAKNLTDALKSEDGLNFKKFVGMLKTSQMNAVFNLDLPFFKRNADAFKAPSRPVPAPRASALPRANTHHRPSTH